MNHYILYPEWISPTIFPGLPFRWYGLMYVIAFGIAYGLTMLQLRQRSSVAVTEVSREQMADLFLWMILGVMLGGRLLATTLYDTSGTYLSKPWLIFWPFDDEMRNGGNGRYRCERSVSH